MKNLENNLKQKFIDQYLMVNFYQKMIYPVMMSMPLHFALWTSNI